jgi:hypothetical protein
MSMSRIIAERALLDARSLVIAMEYATRALQQRQKVKRQLGQQLLRSIEEDVKVFGTEPYQVDDLASQYKLNLKPSDLEEFIEMLQKEENLPALRDKLGKLRAEIEERLYEPFSEGLPDAGVVRTVEPLP